MLSGGTNHIFEDQLNAARCPSFRYRWFSRRSDFWTSPQCSPERILRKSAHPPSAVHQRSQAAAAGLHGICIAAALGNGAISLFVSITAGQLVTQSTSTCDGKTQFHPPELHVSNLFLVSHCQLNSTPQKRKY